MLSVWCWKEGARDAWLIIRERWRERARERERERERERKEKQSISF